MSMYHSQAVLQKMAKVKASDKFSFPASLDTRSLFNVNEGPVDSELDAPEDSSYELAAILFHKGPSASHGHYSKCKPFNKLPRSQKSWRKIHGLYF